MANERVYLLLAAMALSLVAAAPRTGRSADEVPANHFSVHSFRPDLEAGTYFVAPDTLMLGRGRFSAGVSLNYADRPFTEQLSQEVQAQQLVEYLVSAEAFGAFGITDFFSLGFSLPVMRNGGTITTALDGVNEDTPYAAFGLGDLWIGSKLRLLNPQKRRVGLAFLPEISYPFWNPGGFTRESTWTLRLRAASELQLKRFSTAVYAGYRFRPTARVAQYTMTDTLEYGLAAKFRIRERVDAVAELMGSMGSPFDQVDAALDDQENVYPRPLELHLGFRGTSVGGLTVGAGASGGLITSPGGPVFRFFVTLAYRRPAEVDIDRDGLPFSLDRCPEAPESANGIQDEDGCPESDTDGDTLVDPVDSCSTAPEDFDGHQDGDGCPELDNDSDGMEDVRDQCPNEPEDKNGIEDSDGCPEVDKDQDGISDRKDRCPDEPEDANGIEDDDGCPEHLSGGRDAAFDTDQDGVEDRADRCPLVPENRDGVQDWDGCPETDADRDGRPDGLDRCPTAPEDRDGFEDDDGCPEAGGSNRGTPAKPEKPPEPKRPQAPATPATPER